MWVRWVKKTNRKEVVQDRLLAVGIYRIFSIKRTKTGKKQVYLFIYLLIKTNKLTQINRFKEEVIFWD